MERAEEMRGARAGMLRPSLVHRYPAESRVVLACLSAHPGSRPSALQLLALLGRLWEADSGPGHGGDRRGSGSGSGPAGAADGGAPGAPPAAVANGAMRRVASAGHFHAPRMLLPAPASVAAVQAGEGRVPGEGGDEEEVAPLAAVITDPAPSLRHSGSGGAAATAAGRRSGSGLAAPAAGFLDPVVEVEDRGCQTDISYHPSLEDRPWPRPPTTCLSRGGGHASAQAAEPAADGRQGGADAHAHAAVGVLVEGRDGRGAGCGGEGEVVRELRALLEERDREVALLQAALRSLTAAGGTDGVPH